MASEAQIRASRKWEEKNKERVRLNRYKSGAFSFVKQAGIDRLEQLEELKVMLDKKIKTLKEEQGN